MSVLRKWPEEEKKWKKTKAEKEMAIESQQKRTTMLLMMKSWEMESEKQSGDGKHGIRGEKGRRDKAERARRRRNRGQKRQRATAGSAAGSRERARTRPRPEAAQRS